MIQIPITLTCDTCPGTLRGPTQVEVLSTGSARAHPLARPAIYVAHIKLPTGWSSARDAEKQPGEDDYRWHHVCPACNAAAGNGVVDE